jgi:hypothetical protein
LLLRGRMLPSALAWTGVIASVILVVGLPLQLLGLLGAPLTMLMWMPMLAFEVPGGLWLLVKGVPPSSFQEPAVKSWHSGLNKSAARRRASDGGRKG